MKLKREALTVITTALCAVSAFGQGPTNQDRQHNEPAPREVVQRPTAPIREVSPVRHAAPVRDMAPVRQSAPNRQPIERETTHFGPRTQDRVLSNRVTQNWEPTEKRQQTLEPVRTQLHGQPIDRQDEKRNLQVPNHTEVRQHETSTRQVTTFTRREDFFRQDQQTQRLQVRNREVHENQQWGGHWRDDRRNDFGTRFHFGFYLYTPFAAASFVSPWYDYMSVPGYIPVSAGFVISGTQCNWTTGGVYANGGFDPGLNASIGSIEQAFANQDPNAMNGMILPGGQIAVFNGGQYEYTMNGNDFRATLDDSVGAVNTQSFRIDSVQRFNGGATVLAENVVVNPDGTESTIYQSYRLQLEGGDRYYIADFMTSLTPIA